MAETSGSGVNAYLNGDASCSSVGEGVRLPGTGYVSFDEWTWGGGEVSWEVLVKIHSYQQVPLVIIIDPF